MNTTLPDLERNARRAYELGRVRLGAARGALALVLPLAAVTLLGAPALLALVLGGGLAVLFGYAQFKGQALGRGARVGLLLGSFGALVPAMVRASGACCLGASCESTCFTACVLIGLCTGAVAAVVAARDPRPVVHGTSAAVVMLLATGLGCSALGLAEFLGVAAGLTVGGASGVLRTVRAT